MFMLQYKSAAGEYILGGGNHPIANVTKLDGFGLPARSFESIELADAQGLIEIGRKDQQRTITISGTVRGGWHELQRMYRIFYADGDLYCYFDDDRKRISVKLNQFDAPEKMRRSDLHRFTIQLVADTPYFKSFYDIKKSLYDRRNLISDTFTLPQVFTERQAGGNAYNAGDKSINPIVTVTNYGTQEAAVALQNATTGAAIRLQGYNLQHGESVEFDTKSRKIMSSVNGNITKYISSATPDLSAFLLEPGVNNIIIPDADETELTAIIEYTPEYFAMMR